MNQVPVVDAHQHLWTADYPWLAGPGLTAIRQDFTVADLLRVLAPAEVGGTVLVEAGVCEAAETVRFLALAASTPEILGVVGWASFSDPDIAGTVHRYRELPGGALLVGVRDQVQAQSRAYLAHPDVRRMLAHLGGLGLVADLVVRSDQLGECVEAARTTPGTTFVLDHLGKPPIGGDRASRAAWRRAITDLAGCGNTAAKLSGLTQEAGPGWTPAMLQPYVDTALEVFGPDRLMFGSDWPVCTLTASYGQVRAALDTCLAGLSRHDRRAIFGGTAIRVYGLDLL
ncbi:amidohydrolase [Longispora fulva]|uniref:L-fuconolactonase n=1 Tax=Longispora fulva TaxID=619741 RepID=A0A8J7KFS8_9ACTN|nr:amidohydrolase family protein [Longispora fulva]MBG6134104.1 L-fuconolactonase [Longispora fulva]GIG62477.1 amidohydrolase [Longispora fulva]